MSSNNNKGVVVNPIPGKCPIPHTEISLGVVVVLWLWGALSSRSFFLSLFAVFALWASSVFTSKTGGIVKPSDEDGDTINLSHGSVYYCLEGNKNAPNLIVLVHGFQVPSSVWRDMSRELKSRYGETHQILRFDLYGRGYSQAKDIPQTEALFVAQITELLFALNLSGKKLYVCGYSMGGLIAAAFTRAYPHRVEKLALFAPAGMPSPLPPGAQLLTVPLLGNVIAKYLIPNKIRVEMLKMGKINEACKRVAQESIVQLASQYFLRSLLSTMANVPLREGSYIYGELGAKTRPPVLLVWGDRDPICAYSGAKPLLELLNKSSDNAPATLVTVPQALHTLFLEQPDVCQEALFAFLEK